MPIIEPNYVLTIEMYNPSSLEWNTLSENFKDMSVERATGAWNMLKNNVKKFNIVNKRFRLMCGSGKVISTIS